jgi:hypothetical protein
MRLLYLLVVACAGCTPQAPRVELAPQPDVDISFTRSVERDRPMLLVTISNRSVRPICVQRELLQHRYTYAMDLRMRDGKGHELSRYDPGFLPPPLAGTIMIRPGESESGSYYLDARFKLPENGKIVPKGATVRASFRYGLCEEVSSVTVTSSWLPI